MKRHNLRVEKIGGTSMSSPHVAGAGALLAPALPVLPPSTRQTFTPRIALAGTLALACLIVGTLLWMTLFGSAPVTVDRVWFALIGFILLAGLFVFRQKRGQAAGLNWPGKRELAFFGVALLGFLAPVLILPVPLDTDAQGFGYLALTRPDPGAAGGGRERHPGPGGPRRADAGICTLQSCP